MSAASVSLPCARRSAIAIPNGKVTERGCSPQIAKKRPTPSADIADTAPDEQFAPERLAA
jgi:hypothetical protein